MSTNGSGDNRSRLKLPTVLVTGPTAIGKTTSVLRALNPRSTYWICTERGALNVATDPELNPWGYVPDFDETLTTTHPHEECLALVRKGLAGYRAGKYAAIVIDTLSSVCDREYTRIRMIEKTQEAYGRANRILAMRIQQFIWELLDSGALVVCIAHEREAVNIEGKLVPGGPKLAGDLVRSVPSLFDMVLRCSVGADANGNPERVFKVNPLETTYLTKDRFRVVRDGEPMDLKSILKRAVEKTRAESEGTNVRREASQPA